MESNLKKPFLIDVPVLLIFFNRPKCLRQVFEAVKTARPSKLFLYQDGSRIGNESDMAGVEACRKIVEDIDWECEVHTLYQTENYGCDPSGYLARKWAFSLVDKCIILEDDCIPTQSFFPFCKELLDKYADDTRINMICGMNNLDTWETPFSYLFSDTGSIWGVATWRRVIDMWDDEYKLCDDNYSCSLLRRAFKKTISRDKGLLRYWARHKSDGKAYHESIGSICQLTQNMLNIVPSHNLIFNVGNGPEGGTHAVTGLEMIPHGLRRIFALKGHEIEFPLKHPPYMIHDLLFTKKLHRIMGDGYPLVQMYRQIEKVLLILKHKGLKEVIRKYKGRKL